MSSPQRAHVVRRSVAIPAEVVASALDAAPPELRTNFNRLTIVALREYTERQRAIRLEQAIAEMAADPAIQAACGAISVEFGQTDADGLVR
jgi:hypothetical protein